VFDRPVEPAPAPQPLLRAREISKRFGGLLALDSVDLDLRTGEIVGLIGPNGAGKTTFVNCITGVERPTGGRVIFDGVDLLRVPAYQIGKLGLARTFQIVRPFRSMSMRENVAVGALFGRSTKRRSAKEAMARADEILQFTGLWERRDTHPSNLSVADSKRLELAKALAMDPRLLVLDEVMAGLNPSESEKAVDLIRDIADTGVTILVIEHVMKVITSLASRVVVLHQGKKLAEGEPAAVLSDPIVIEAYLGQRYAQRAIAQGNAGVEGGGAKPNGALS
jgi:branched-chain amino acid transport system ATP-binding protein